MKKPTLVSSRRLRDMSERDSAKDLSILKDIAFPLKLKSKAVFDSYALRLIVVLFITSNFKNVFRENRIS